MSNFKKLIQSLILCLGTLAAFNTYGLAKFSRACPFADVPAALQAPVVLLFYAIGSAPLSKFSGLPFLSTDEKYKYWTLESITANYGSVKYYLYAETKAYRYYESSNKHFLETGFTSNGWRSDTLPDSVLVDPDIKPLFANRGLGVFANARAGHPEIIQYWSPRRINAYRDFWTVLGQHYYFDALANDLTYLGQSRATDCNFFEWGVGLY